MKVKCQTFDLSSLIVSPEQLAPRTEGTHVSYVVRKLSRAMGKRDGDFTEEQLNRFAVVGRLWERLLADALFNGPRYVRPGEIDLDNIYGSPDCVDTEQWAVLEFKVTWVSSREFESKQKWWEYLLQIKSYCCQLGMCRARLIVMFVCGDWRPPVPQAFEWDLLFTAQELGEHWRMILANKA